MKKLLILIIVMCLVLISLVLAVPPPPPPDVPGIGGDLLETDNKICCYTPNPPSCRYDVNRSECLVFGIVLNGSFPEENRYLGMPCYDNDGKKADNHCPDLGGVVGEGQVCIEISNGVKVCVGTNCSYYYDSCRDNTILEDAYCSENNYVKKDVYCENGCEDKTCLPEPITSDDSSGGDISDGDSDGGDDSSTGAAQSAQTQQLSREDIEEMMETFYSANKSIFPFVSLMISIIVLTALVGFMVYNKTQFSSLRASQNIQQQLYRFYSQQNKQTQQNRQNTRLRYDMQLNRLSGYISSSLRKGMSFDQVHNVLMRQGWTNQQIMDAYRRTNL